MTQQGWEKDWNKLVQIGEGGQGITIKVQSRSEPAMHAVVKLLKDGGSEQARHRMAIEAINQDRLNKNGVKVPKVLIDGTTGYKQLEIELYLVMEFVEGKTLDKVVEANGGHLSLEQSIAIARDLCGTVSEMHRLEVLHRDLKPANLMVRDLDQADVVVLDLGLSYDRTSKGDSVTRTHETIKNELVVLPEATTFNGARRDPRSDITNIVCVLFYCLTGHLFRNLLDEKSRAPHRREGFRMQEVLKGDPRFAQMELFFDVGLSHDIDGRFQSIEDLLSRLSLAQNGEAPAKKSPVDLDRELGAIIRKASRPVQLKEMSSIAQTASQGIQRSIARYQNKLTTFEVKRMGIHPMKPVIPNGIDPLITDLQGLSVNVKAHDKLVGFALWIGAKGDQCVLMRTEVLRGKVNTVYPINGHSLVEVLWFSSNEVVKQETADAWVDNLVSLLINEAYKDLGLDGSASV